MTPVEVELPDWPYDPLHRSFSRKPAAAFEELTTGRPIPPTLFPEPSAAPASNWSGSGRCLLARLPLFHGGTGVFFYSLWCPGKTILLEEDAVALLSPELYQRFIYAADCRIAQEFQNAMMHLHPTRFIPSRLLASTALAAVELHIDHDGPRAEALEPHYRAILERKPLLVWGDLTGADLEFILSRVPRRGLAVNMIAGSVVCYDGNPCGASIF